MRPLTTVTSVVAPLLQSDVDTDQIVPARFLSTPREDGYARFLFHDLRYDHSGAERPGFVLNRCEFRRAEVLLAGPNFGCGSSREAAVYALADYGIRVVVAPSYGEIFSNNCVRNGILPITLAPPAIDALVAHLAPAMQVAVDLASQEIRVPGRPPAPFDFDPFWKEALLRGFDEIGLTFSMAPEIEAFEGAYYTTYRWLRRRK